MRMIKGVDVITVWLNYMEGELVVMKCPSCGAEVKNGGICEYCGTQIPFQSENEQPKKIEYTENTNINTHQNQNSYNNQYSGEYKDSNLNTYPNKKRKFNMGIMVLWVLGWILFFPIPVMILIWRKKNKWSIKTKLIATAVFWIVLWGYGSCRRINNRNNTSKQIATQAPTETKETISSTNAETTKKISETEQEKPEKEKPEKNGFDSKTNKEYTMNSFTISIPSYWYVKTHNSTDLLAYAEVDGKTAMIQIEAEDFTNKDEYDITYDGLKTDVENGEMDTLLKSQITIIGDVDTMPFDNGLIRGFVGKFRFNEMSHDGIGNVLFFIPENTRELITIFLVESDNTEYTYLSDFDKILNSIKPIKHKEEHQESVPSDIETIQATIEPETEHIISGNLTVKNCPELKEILSSKEEGSDLYADFATKYKDRVIEFDGSIDYCVNHGTYKTRFDYLVSAWDYSTDTQSGPTFKFENVAYYNLHTDLPTVSVGKNVHIEAKVKSYNKNADIFFLDPVSVTSR